MKILIYRYGSICEPDIISGFEELGHKVSQITDEIYQKDLIFADQLKIVSEFLLSHPQDAVFTINFFPVIAKVCNIFKIPYISWTVDSPVMELFTTAIELPWNRIFVFDREQYREIVSHNPENVFHFPLAVNVKEKQEVIRNASTFVRRKFQSDVSFVGSLYSEKCPYDKFQSENAYVKGYVDALMEAQRKVYGYYFVEEALTEEIIEEFRNHLPGFYISPLDNFLTDRSTVAQLYIGNKITAMERAITMEVLSEHFSMDLYTGSDTSKLPKIHNRGFAKTLTEMPVIFHESKVNLNTTSKAIRSGIPLRVFDIMGCEGFVLSNYQVELSEFFIEGEEFDCYTSMEEMVEKTAFYLEHEKIRKEIAHNGFLKVQELYNYPGRLEEMLKLARVL